MRAYCFAVSATAPLCFCGSHTLTHDSKLRLRCKRGHFAKPFSYELWGWHWGRA